jgi:hypothetical protein
VLQPRHRQTVHLDGPIIEADDKELENTRRTLEEIAIIENDIGVALLRLSEIDQGGIDETKMKKELDRGIGTGMATAAIIVAMSPREKIEARGIGNIPGGDGTDRTRSRGLAAGHRAGTERLTAIDMRGTIANLSTMHDSVLVHQNTANPGRRDTRIHRLAVLVPNTPLEKTDLRLPPDSQSMQARNQIPSKISSDRFLRD